MNIDISKGIFFRYSRAEKSKNDIWFIHGFGESGLCFAEAFSSNLAKNYNLFAPDLPGFGVSPANIKIATVDGMADILLKLTDLHSKENKLTIVGHSLGAFIALRMAEKLGSKLSLLISIDGSIISNVSKKAYYADASEIRSPLEYANKYRNTIFQKCRSDKARQRYLSSLWLCDPKALHSLGADVHRIVSSSKIEDDFLKLKCRKIYFWNKETAQEVVNFLHKNNIENYRFENSGHWPMIDESEKCYAVIGHLVEGA